MAVSGQTIDMTSALTALSRMMGKRTLPQGDNSDWMDYVQEAFNYAWRYYQWDWSMKLATIDLVSAAYLPADFDLGGFREAQPTTDGYITEVTLADYARLPSGLRNFALEWDDVNDRYNILTNSGLSTMDVLYQVAPPSLSDTDTNGAYIPVRFPSATVIGVGGAIWAKQGENPTRADVKQEWDIFHRELNRHVGRMTAHTTRPSNMNLQDYAGTYTGDVRY